MEIRMRPKNYINAFIVLNRSSGGRQWTLI